MNPFYVVTTLRGLKNYYSQLKCGDLILTRLPLKREDFPLVIDLLWRGVLAYPSFISQILSKSKTAQAEILSDYMLPYTYVIKNRTSLLQVMEAPPPFKKFVTKKDFANCGLGIFLWNDLEEIFRQAGAPPLEFPFVLQPFYEEWQDIRVVFLGELYLEAYTRENRGNFRQNLFFGGKAKPYELSPEEIAFCQAVMNRGGFPYAHLDLAYVAGNGPYLVEINLKGGIKGAKISVEEYEKTLKALEDRFFQEWKKNHTPYEIV